MCGQVGCPRDRDPKGGDCPKGWLRAKGLEPDHRHCGEGSLLVFLACGVRPTRDANDQDKEDGAKARCFCDTEVHLSFSNEVEDDLEGLFWGFCGHDIPLAKVCHPPWGEYLQIADLVRKWGTNLWKSLPSMAS